MTLTGPAAGDLLRAAFGDVGPVVLRRVSTGPDGTTVAYRAGSRWLYASTEPAPDGARIVDGVVVWQWPDDPWLPGLRSSVSAAAVSLRLGRPVERLVLRTYRPGRRAVVQGPGVFLKVLRPSRGADVAARHALLSDLPVPAVLWSDPSGVLALDALPGRQGREALRAGRAMPSGADLVALLSRLPTSLLSLPARPSWSDGAARYAASVGEAVPRLASRAAAVAGAVLAGVGGLPADDPVHGDLHAGQLLVTGGRVSGLLDLDRAGPGRRADDLACLLAHVEALVVGGRVARRRGRRLLGDWGAASSAVVDRDELRLRTAGVLLSLATGPYRVQARGWEEATEALLRRAEEHTGPTLTA